MVLTGYVEILGFSFFPVFNKANRSHCEVLIKPKPPSNIVLEELGGERLNVYTSL